MTIPIHLSPTIVPIQAEQRQIALEFAQQQPTRERALQVYRNTLAVLAAKHCLDILEIPTDLASSDAWNPFSRMASDVADLPLVGLGRLECRPISPAAQFCPIPAEAIADRIGYLIVQFDAAYRAATLVGFSTQVTGEPLSLNQLSPLEDLLIHLELLQTQPATPEVTRLSEWFEAIADHTHSIWQTIGAGLDSSRTPALAFRALPGLVFDTPESLQQTIAQLYASQSLSESAAASSQPLPSHPSAALAHLIQTTVDEEIRWTAAEVLWAIDPGHPASGMRRVLDLGLLLGGHSLALIVAVLRLPQTATTPERFSILTRVQPLMGQGYLPHGLQLAVLTADGSVGLQTQARERDNYIQLKLRGEMGEHFSIRLSLGEDVITQYFVI